MSKLFEKPHIPFLIAIPIVMLIGIVNGDYLLDIHIYDSVYVISHLNLAKLIAILFSLTAIIYWLVSKSNRRLSKRLNCIHITLTFGGILIVGILSQLYRPETMEYQFNENLTLTIILVIILMVCGQLILPINIIRALVKKKGSQ